MVVVMKRIFGALALILGCWVTVVHVLGLPHGSLLHRPGSVRASGAFSKIVDPVQGDPIIVVALMVKNEEHVMRATLEPFLKGGIKHFLIYDTGSTDKTVEVTRALFDEYKITQAYVIQEPFIDFAQSRNRALDLFDEKFPHATFVLMIDAEWYIHDVPTLIAFCEQHRYEVQQPVYLLRITNYITNFYHARLIRRTAQTRFEGVVHEQLNQPACIKLPDSVYFEYTPSEQGCRQSRDRWERDCRLLLAEHKKNPEHARTAFYLAQTYGALGDMYNAYKYYTIRKTLDGFDEETFLAHYRLGLIAEFLAKSDKNFTWQMAQNHFLDAFAYRPTRVEPLLSLALHYWNEKNLEMCYLFARRAAELPYPSDFFCVEKYLYDVTRYDILSVCAITMGDLEVGEWATRMALKGNPNDERIKTNLATCENHKALRLTHGAAPKSIITPGRVPQLLPATVN